MPDFVGTADPNEYGDILNMEDEPARAPGEMEDEQFRSTVKAAIDDAVDYIDGFVAEDRAKAIKYYRGEPFGNEEEGRSQIVMTETRDVIQAIVPSLLRIFAQSDKIVEFAPRSAAAIEQAEQSTDYVNLVFYGDNPGFAILHSWFKDALTCKTGIVKWRWSTDVTVTETEFTDLEQAQVAILEQDKYTEILDLQEKPGEQGEPQPPQLDPQTGQPVSPAPPPSTFDVRIRRKVPANRAIVEAVPPEEFIVSRFARDIETSPYTGHRSYKTVSSLVSMGYDREEIEENLGGGSTFSLNTETQSRNPAIMSFMDHADSPDKTMSQALYVESYVRIDRDGDGIAELYKVCSIGDAHHILHYEVTDSIPFAFLCPDPEPHMLIGWSVADQTMDLQLIKSNVVRSTLDSLAQVIHPRTVVVEGQVNMDDAMNTQTGAIIRARAPGMVAALSEPFVGQAAIPIIAWLDQVRAQRTGISQASQGLDPDVLQSTTKSAVTATVNGAQERIELIARIFAETGVKRLFRGLLKLIVQHQDKPRTVRMRGKWVTVDPRTWDADLDVTIDVALGRGTEQDRMQFLMLVAAKQEQIIQLLGPINPLCDIQQYRNTLAQIVSLSGIKDASKYFKEIDQATMQRIASTPQDKKPDPTEQLVQLEMAKVQNDAAHKQAQLALDTREVEMKDDREREKIRMDAMVSLAEIEARYQTTVETAHIEAAISSDNAAQDREHETERHRQATLVQGLVDHHATETQAGVDRHAAETAAASAPIA